MKKTAFLLVLIFSSGCLSPQQLPGEPKQIFLQAGESENFVYYDHEISISYHASSPAQKFELVIDGEKEIIDIDLNTSCPGSTCFYSSKKGDITYTMQPVTWENRDGGRVWSFGSWNTSEIYFQIIKG